MKTKQIIILILCIGLSIAFFLFKDNIIGMLPDNNAAYREKFATYEQTEAVILKQERVKGKRGPARLVSTVKFSDKEGNEYTYELDENALEGTKPGDKTIIYYNPADPEYDVESERVYKEVMRIN